jgi:membrane protein
MQWLTQIKRTVVTSLPVTFAIRKSKKIFLPGFSGLPLFDVIRFFFQQARRVGFTERASSIAFNFVMAIPPAIIFLFTLIPLLPISKDFIRELYGLIQEVIPGQKVHSPLIGFLDDFFKNPRNGLLSLGFILALFFSSNAMMGIMRSFNKDYPGFTRRTHLQNRRIALRMTVIFFVYIILSILVLIMQGMVLTWFGIEGKVQWIIRYARWIIIIFLFFFTISYIYRHAPARAKKWPLVNPGSILATALMILFTMFFSYWVNNFANYKTLYGPISTVLILMLLIYFNSLVLLIGFELNVSISSLKRIADERKENNTNGNSF